MSWPTEVTRFLADLLGITERRQAEQQWRQGAAAARPGEVWTIRVFTRDAHDRLARSWVSGPVEVRTDRGRELKMLGQEYLPEQARPLSPMTGLLAGRTSWHLERGDQGMPPRLPRAGADDLAAVPAGTDVMVEVRMPAHPQLRCIESGTTGHVLHHHGVVGRYVGSTWVVLDDVLGLIRTSHDQLTGASQRDQGGSRPPGGPVSLTADAGLSADGER